MNVISFVGLSAPALLFRVFGVVLALIGLVVAIRSQRRHRDDVWSNEKRVAFRAGRSLVDVRGLEESLPPGSISTQVKTYDDLVAIATQCARPILREERAEGEIFGVDVPPRLYLYRKPVRLPVETLRSRPPCRRSPPRRRRCGPGFGLPTNRRASPATGCCRRGP